MTLDQVKESYKILIGVEGTKLSKLKRKIFQVGSVRLAIVLLCILICYLSWGHTMVVLFSIGVSIVLFLFFMKYHNKLFTDKKYCEVIIQNAENELKGLDYDFSSFDGAPEKSDGSHSYSLDLDMFGDRSFFQSVNRTVTRFGKNKLADLLLNPYNRKSDIITQQDALKELSEKFELLNAFRATGIMNEAEDLDMRSLSQLFMQTKPLSKSIWRYFIYFAPIIFVTLIVLYILELIPLSVIGLSWSVFFMISLIPMKDVKGKMKLFDKKIEILQTYSKLFKIIEDNQFSSDLLTKLQDKIKLNQPASVAVYQLKSYSDNLDQSFNVLGFLFLNPVCFWNVLYSIKIEKWMDLHNENIVTWLDVLSEFDSSISLALFSYNHPDYIYPEVSDRFVFEAEGLGHPLINRTVCVRNDVSMDKRPFFLVVTGANMAGKSTYLRTIGINLMLACTGAPVCATSLTFYPYHLVTNLRTSDSLSENESYFFAELKRLKMIIDRLQSGEHLFIILDEILKGTNSEDKQKGSLALMKQLVSLKGNGIIATHDLVLGKLEEEYPDAIKNYRFEADIKDNELSFSYKIREGVAQNMNASFLMKKMGITGL